MCQSRMGFGSRISSGGSGSGNGNSSKQKLYFSVSGLAGCQGEFFFWRGGWRAGGRVGGPSCEPVKKKGGVLGG